MSAVAAPIVALKLPGWRSRTLLVLLLAGFLVLIGRAVYLQGLQRFPAKKGNARYGADRAFATRGILPPATASAAISTPVEVCVVQPRRLDISPPQMNGCRSCSSSMPANSPPLAIPAGVRVPEAHLPPEQAAR